MADQAPVTYVTFFSPSALYSSRAADFADACNALKELSDDVIVKSVFLHRPEVTRIVVLSKEHEQFRMLFASRADDNVARIRGWTLASVPGNPRGAASMYFDQSALSSIAESQALHVARGAGRVIIFTITNNPLLFPPELLGDTTVTRWEVDAEVETINSDTEEPSITLTEHDTRVVSDTGNEDTENENHVLAPIADVGALPDTQASAVSTTLSYPPDYANILNQFRPRQQRFITNLSHKPGFATLSPPDQMLSQLTGCVKVEQYKAYKAKFLAKYRAFVQTGQHKSIQAWSEWAIPAITLIELNDDEIPKHRGSTVYLRMISGWKAMGEF